MNCRINKNNLKKLWGLAGRYAPGDLYYKIREKLAAPYGDYGRKYQSYLPSLEELAVQRESRFSYAPLISIVVPAYETEELFLCQMIDSVLAQTYPNWELCIADGSKSDKVRRTVAGYARESRIKYKKLEKNEGISENTNQGFAMACGEYIGLLDHDDLLVASALYEMVKRINETGADFLYSDEDKVSSDLSEYMDPHFKLDFNRELLLGNNYICHFLLVSSRVLKEAGGLDSRYNGAQDFDFVLRCSEYAEKIEHIPRILYHWRMHSGSTAGNTDSKPYAYEAGKRAVEAAHARNGQKGVVTMSKDPGFYRTSYEMPGKMVIGICRVMIHKAEWSEAARGEKSVNISPGHGIRNENIGNSPIRQIPEGWKNQIARELASCGAELLWDYRFDRPVDYIIFLNMSVRTIPAGGIRELLGSCARPGVGLVGSKVIAGKKVCQCGMWSREGGWQPRFEGLPRPFKGYFRRAYLPVEVDGVSPELAVLDYKVFEKIEIGSFSAITVNQAQVELSKQWLKLCTGIKAAGYKIIINPAVEVVINE